MCDYTILLYHTKNGEVNFIYEHFSGYLLHFVFSSFFLLPAVMSHNCFLARWRHFTTKILVVPIRNRLIEIISMHHVQKENMRTAPVVICCFLWPCSLAVPVLAGWVYAFCGSMSRNSRRLNRQWFWF